MIEEDAIFEMEETWGNYKGVSWKQKRGDITWIMRPRRLNQLADNDDVYLEFKILYEKSNLWELHTENELYLYSSVTRERIDIKKSCYFNHKRTSIRFELGKLKTIRDSVACSKRDLKHLTFCMVIKVVKKSTVGIRMPPTDIFRYPENIDTEVVLKFLIPGQCPHQFCRFYVDRLALTTVSSKFHEIFSNEPNGECMIEDIVGSTHYEKWTVLLLFVRFLYRRKQEFRNDEIEGILYLAVRYNIQFLIIDCEEFLISTKKISNSMKLCLAEKCNLPMLQLSALENIKIEILEQEGLNIFEVFHEMGPKTLKALLVKFCEEHKEYFEPYN